MGMRLLCLIIGYAFGLIQTAYIYGKLHGIDIRTVGSGNAGTTNTLRNFGTKAGIIVLVGDILKTVAAITVVKLLIVPSMPDLRYLLSLYAAAGVILGHNYPFYMGFKGGKGIAATAGMMLSFNPYFAIGCVVAFLVPFLVTHYVSLGSLCIYAAFVIMMVLMGQTGAFNYWCGMSDANLPEMYILAILLLIMAYWRHRSNIVKLLHGTERKTYLFKKKSAADSEKGNI